jgi:PAS domain S-box-containing protein
LNAVSRIRQGGFLETLLDHLKACVAVVQGRDLRYAMVNPAYQSLRPEMEMVGRTYEEVFPQALASAALLHKVMETGVPDTTTGYHLPIPGKPDAVWNHQFVRLPRAEAEEPSVLIVAWDVTEHKRRAKQAEQALVESDKRLARKLNTAQKLQEISTQLIQTGDLEELYDKILDTAVEILQSDFASLQMFHPERGPIGELSLLGYRGFDAQAAEFWQLVKPASQSVCGQALRIRQRVVVPDVLTCDAMAGSDDLKMYLKTGIRAVQTTPLLARSGNLLGMLSTHWREPRVLLDSELRAIDVLARQAADLIDRKKAEKALRAEQARLEAVLRQLPEGVIIAEALSGKLISFNAQVQEIWRKDLLFARNIEAYDYYKGFYPDGRQYRPDEWPLARTIARGETVKHEEIRIQRGDGSFGWISVNSSPICDQKGKVIAGVSTFSDITERKLAAEDLLKSQSRLKAALQIAQLGVWEYDAASSRTRFDSRCREIFGLPEDRGMTNQEMFERIHPEDRARVESEVLAAITEEHTGQYDTEYRIARPDGEVVWVAVRGNANKSSDGTGSTPHNIIGTAMDITSRKAAEEELRRLNESLEQRVAERTALAESRASQLQALAALLIETEERERRRISRLLQEDLLQVIASARLQLQAFGHELPHEPMIINIDKLLEESIGKSRRILHELSPQVLEHSSLATVLRWLARHMNEQFGMRIELELDVGETFDNESVKVFVFRATQELLFNVHKHAGVKSAKVKVSRQSKRNLICVTVSDQGRGFNPPTLDSANVKEGFGLLSLRERASYVGGDFLIQSAPGEGSTFILSIPENFRGISRRKRCVL